MGAILKPGDSTPDPAIDYGVHIEDKNGIRPRSGSTHSGGYRPAKFGPGPTPKPLPKKEVSRYRGRGGGGGWISQHQKIHCGMVLSPRMMILQGVRQRISHIGVSNANQP